MDRDRSGLTEEAVESKSKGKGRSGWSEGRGCCGGLLARSTSHDLPNPLALLGEPGEQIYPLNGEGLSLAEDGGAEQLWGGGGSSDCRSQK